MATPHDVLVAKIAQAKRIAQQLSGEDKARVAAYAAGLESQLADRSEAAVVPEPGIKNTSEG